MRYYEHGGNAGENIKLDFSVNINPLGMLESVKQAIIDNADNYTTYPDPDCKELCRALSEKLNVPPDYILCGNGASDLILRVCAALRPKRAYTLTPTFSEYERCVRLFDGEIARGIFDIAFVCSPNNPTGTLTPLAEIERLLKTGVAVVIDECFIEFTYGESALLLLSRYPNLLILRAFTKIFAMAGLRLGYLLCSDKHLLRRIAENGAVWSVSSVAIAAGIAALKERDFITLTREFVKTERKYVMGQLSELGFEVTPSEANFMLIKSETSLYKPLVERGVLVRDCSNFATLNEHYFRIGLKKRDENNILLNEIRGILNG
jgi:histidinol-phosphate/aromatic aminotransferase/cobyric acid decarboxylase-like protein